MSKPWLGAVHLPKLTQLAGTWGTWMKELPCFHFIAQVLSSYLIFTTALSSRCYYPSHRWGSEGALYTIGWNWYPDLFTWKLRIFHAPLMGCCDELLAQDTRASWPEKSSPQPSPQNRIREVQRWREHRRSYIQSLCIKDKETNY